MEKEMKSLEENNVWDLVELPEGCKTVNWCSYKMKTGADGSVECYKARLVAQDSSQKIGTDYNETFAQWSDLNHFALILWLYSMDQVDVTTTCLNSTELEEEVYVRQLTTELDTVMLHYHL